MEWVSDSRETRLRSKDASGGNGSLESPSWVYPSPIPSLLWLTVPVLDSFQCLEQLTADVFKVSACFSQALGHYRVRTVDIYSWG